MFFDVMIKMVYQSTCESILILQSSNEKKKVEKINKGVWGMPRLSEAKKDVPSCEKLRGFAEKS